MNWLLINRGRGYRCVKNSRKRRFIPRSFHILFIVIVFIVHLLSRSTSISLVMHLNAATVMRNVSQSILAKMQRKPRVCARGSRASEEPRSQRRERRVFIYLIGEQQRSEDYTNCSPRWLDEVGGEASGTRPRGAGSRAAGGHRGCDTAPAESSDEQSRPRARIQVTTSIYLCKLIKI